MAACPLNTGYYYISTRENQSVSVFNSAVVVNGVKTVGHVIFQLTLG